MRQMLFSMTHLLPTQQTYFSPTTKLTEDSDILRLMRDFKTSDGRFQNHTSEEGNVRGKLPQ